jgi:hypothetical protein
MQAVELQRMREWLYVRRGHWRGRDGRLLLGELHAVGVPVMEWL